LIGGGSLITKPTPSSDHIDDLRNYIAPVAASGAIEQIANCRVDRYFRVIVAGKSQSSSSDMIVSPAK
jgi:hypothetical protein